VSEERRFGIPTWVYVWAWARQYREPPLDPNVRLPQQAWEPEKEADPAALTRMSEQDYALLHDEWFAAGAPRHDPRALLGA
jgi:hypothetical protein